MLELRDYSANEITEIFGTNRLNNIERSLRNYQVEFTKTESGNETIYTITAINDELRLFCIMDLGFAPQTDMRKLTNFLYYFLNIDGYVNLPNLAKQRLMEDENRGVGRGTIGRYIRKLEEANYVATSSEFIYYFILKNHREITTRETYNKAWREYFRDKELGADSRTAMLNMLMNYGGYARKYAPTEQNAIYAKEINHLNDLVLERIQELYKENEAQTADSKDKDCQQSEFYFLLKHLAQ